MKAKTLLNGITKTNKALYTGMIAVGSGILATQAIYRLIANKNSKDSTEANSVNHIEDPFLSGKSEETLEEDTQEESHVSSEDIRVLEVPVSASKKDSSPSLLTFLNEADVADIAEVKGLGEARAQSIVKHRPYNSEQEVLDASNGIGSTVFNRISTYIEG